MRSLYINFNRKQTINYYIDLFLNLCSNIGQIFVMGLSYEIIDIFAVYLFFKNIENYSGSTTSEFYQCDFNVIRQ